LLVNLGILSGISGGNTLKIVTNNKNELFNMAWITITHPYSGEIYNGFIIIQWEWGGAIPILPVFFDIYYMDNSSEKWNIIVIDYKKSEYNWDTQSVPDGQYLIRIDLVLDSDLDGHGDMIWMQDISDDFFIIENFNDPPYIPSNPNPEDGSINVNINTNFSWDGGDPDPGDIVTYNILLGIEPESLVCIASAHSSEIYNPGKLLHDTQYYWKIDAYDSEDVTEGLIWTFKTVKNKPPNIPSNPIPANGSINVNLNLTLNWTGGDPDNDSVLYDVYFGNNSNPSIIETNLSTTTCLVNDLKTNTTYYWKINAYDDVNLTEGPIWIFTTIECPPPPPPNTPNAPLGASSTKPGLEYTYQTNTTDPNQNILYYCFDWGDNTNSGWIGPYESGKTASANHTWNEEDTYWIKVKAKNDPNCDGDLSDGSESLWSRYLQVVVPKNKPAYKLLELFNFHEKIPLMFQALKYLLHFDIKNR
jgi:hypothetical protein